MSCDVWPVYTIRFHFSICLPCDHHTHDDQGSNRVWAILSLFKRFTFSVLFQFIKNIAEKTEGKGPSPRHTIKRLTPKQHIFSSELTPRAISKSNVCAAEEGRWGEAAAVYGAKQQRWYQKEMICIPSEQRAIACF